MFSAAAFAVLLVPITGYGVMVRQRERREEEEAAERREREAAANGAPPDPLLEFFAPLQPRPADLPGAGSPSPSPRFQARPGLTGRSTLSTPSSNRAPSAFTPSPPSSPPRERASQERPFVAAAGGEGTGPSPQTIQVAGLDSDSVRRAPVSGEPPWEPASRPTTELPWAVLSASGSARTSGTESSSPAIQPPPNSVWNSAAAPAQRSSAPKSLFEPTPAPPPRSTQPGEAPPAQRPAPSRSGPGSRPAPPRPAPPGEAAPAQRSGLGLQRSAPPRPASQRPAPARESAPAQRPAAPARASGGQPKRTPGQSRRGGAATPPAPTPAPMPAPVPQPTSWQDLPGASSDRGSAFVRNPVSDEFPASDRIGDLPRRGKRSGRH